MHVRPLIAALAAAIVAGSVCAAQLPNFDAVAEAPRVAPATERAVAAFAGRAPQRMQWDDRFGVPTFVWAAGQGGRTVAAARVTSDADPVAAARAYVDEYASFYELTPTDVEDAYVASVHDTGRGAIVVKLRQKIGNVDVFRDELNVVLNRDRSLVALSGHISPLPRAGAVSATSTQATPFLLTAANAIGAASGEAVDGIHFLHSAAAGFDLYDDGSGSPVRVKRVYFHLPGQYEPAYYLERYNDGDLIGYVFSAIDGRLLFRNDMTVSDAAPLAYSYRVWASESGAHLPLSGPQGYDGTPNPTGTRDGYQPTFILPGLVSAAYGPISTKDPWLANDATETVGNNVDAYADVAPPDGYSGGDLRARTTAPLMFDRTFDVTQSPNASADQQMAAITQLFYDVNFLHDWYYDAGFNEAAGNAQTNNFGRGGVDNDNIRAEAQDYGGRNNANMSTPSDGGRPRMQMYLWDGLGNRDLRVDSPSSAAGSFVTGGANFGVQSYDVSGEVVGVTPPDGCGDITTNLTGKIAFIDRGGGANCTFSLKVQHAKAAGAIGVIIGNVSSSLSPSSVVTMACASSPCTAAEAALPPALLIALADADLVRDQLPGSMHVRMRRDPSVDRDGTIDNQVVAHEWMHYMSNRLISDGVGLVNQQGMGMGEGWSDFNALLLTVRPDDTRYASDALFDGAYATAVYVTSGGANGPLLNYGTYYGIRRLPYSTDLAKDPLTLKHVMDGISISGAPLRSGADGANNAEVHNTGEVWCTMLWEAYASLLRDTIGTSPRLTFAEAQQRMKEYLVASLKMTPPSPTFLEARDALLAAAFARDKTDYGEFWAAFAKRGAGFDAVAPERYSASNGGGAEDFNGSGGIRVTSVSIDDSASSCLQNGLLDGGESGAIRISLRNIGGVRLQATTLTVASSDASLALSAPATASVPPSDPGDTVVATVGASLLRIAAIVDSDLTITVTDPQITTAGGMQSVYHARLNAFDMPHASATDDVEAATTAWTTAGTGASQWTRLEISPRDHRWYAPEPWNATDESLVSPPVVVEPGTDFSFTFRHRFAFDYFQSTSVGYIDGGLVEISTDDGKTWSDVGDKIDPATTRYGGIGILAGNGSAIENRRAFEGVSPHFDPDLPSRSPFTTTTVRLGTAYAGQRVRIRFRLVTGADHSTAARQGWEIDDIAFDHIANLPFAAVTPDPGLCDVSQTTTTLTSPVTSAGSGQPVTFTATIASSTPAAGTVDFYDNGAILATAAVTDGVAKLTEAALTPGVHAITARFNGGKYFNASSSGPLEVSIGDIRRRRAVGK